MNIKSIQLFLHLCESKSFSQTAQAMHVSPSALSRIIQRLEDEFEQPLFIRDKRSVELTPAGKTLLPHAATIAAKWQEAKAEITQHDALAGKVTLFCSVTASYSHLPDILSRFREQYPHVEIQLLTGDPAQAIDKIFQDQADIAITAKPQNMPNALTYVELGKVDMSVIAPLFPQAGLVIDDNPDWSLFPYILPDSGTAREKADRWLKNKKVRPHIYAQVGGHEAIVSMVALGCGIGIAPDVVIDNSPVGSRVRRMEQIEALELGLCCRRSRHDEPLLKALLDLFRRNQE
ncbi:HTH-type transcriptional activator IlvY [Vibrio sp. SCSIO 43136]|uniref:HTH-type transcriptional activator IlvY n=1 Tax=Vibrio sp. SCSIO 43136 TaxID=2819101 RepID=UPI0020757DD1|nr:HTH-type transcriptional activator IlvY [Vibrio sp. SCSIO 43136]USD65340.1 HTH-type transcriptional activator IlvY [Vibrio sp. SCSIO 43136]